MNSLGVIETRGLVAAIQAVDAACKAAGVTCIDYRKVGSAQFTRPLNVVLLWHPQPTIRPNHW